MQSNAASLPGPAGNIEAAVDSLGYDGAAVAVLCHPHPLQQGTMHNKVVTTLARAFARLGAIAVRFNFRGVGASTGVHDNGVGERGDALAAVAWARQRWPGVPLYLGGFSFGAAVALNVAAVAEPRGLVTVAPPVERLAQDFTPPRCRWLLVRGTADDVVPAEPVLTWARALPAPPELAVLDGVGHFFHGQLRALEERVTRFFAADFPAATVER
ncbi:MAG TPA: alpha/beta fold hydrolase [Gammaproteobacteria bacterium]|nr:alpha/beta fold hydrolase [Gammaproteobacteria bacterium]